MTPSPQARRTAVPGLAAAAEPLDLTSESTSPFDTEFDQEQWAEQPRRGNAAPAAGRCSASPWPSSRRCGSPTPPGRPAVRLPDSRFRRPQFAQWIAVAAGPLALLGLVWLMFGRTRRKEAERFTRSVIAMRTEARSLEALLEVLSQRISDSRTELTMISQHLMQLGDEATGKLGGITREFDTSTEQLTRHGEALDRAAESARNDIAVLLDDLPRAEADRASGRRAASRRSAANPAAKTAAIRAASRRACRAHDARPTS